jgi:hypothetical protein
VAWIELKSSMLCSKTLKITSDIQLTLITTAKNLKENFKVLSIACKVFLKVVLWPQMKILWLCILYFHFAERRKSVATLFFKPLFSFLSYCFLFFLYKAIVSERLFLPTTRKELPACAA